jgi:capsular exopolysaccharide synthesis family protein
MSRKSKTRRLEVNGNSPHAGKTISGNSQNGVGQTRIGLHTQENELQRVLHVLRRRAIPIMLAVLVVAGAAVAFSLTQPNRYTGSASILFRSQSLAQELPGSTSPTVDPQTQAATNLELVSLEQVAARTARQLDHGFTPQKISDSVDVAAKGASNVIDVKASWGKPETAARIATTFAQQFVRFQADAERARIRAAQHRLFLTLKHERASAAPDQARINTIQANLDDLQVLKGVSSGQAQVIQRADVPTSPSSPKPLRNAIIGVFAGLLLGIALAIALEQLDRRVRSAAEFEELLGVPLLAQIPKSDGFISSATSPIPVPPLETEFFGILNTTIQRLDHGNGVSSLLITSPTAELGKTTIGLNLALAAARAGARTLFLEVDLRRPIVAQRLGISSERNLVQALTERLPLAEVVQSIPVPLSDSDDEGVELDVVVAGPQSRDAPRLIESTAMEHLIEEAEEAYDFVIVDAPPAGLISDAVALLSLIETAVIVCKVGTTTRDQVLWLRSQFEQLDENVLGVVANYAPVKIDQYYGAYRWQMSQDIKRTLAISGRK